MNPETVQALGAVATIIEKLGALPIGTMLLVMMFGPWIFAFIMTRSQEKRFEAVESMYKNNVKLVECYEELARRQDNTISLNTAKWTEVKDKIDTNQFCPMARVKKTHMEDVRG